MAITFAADGSAQETLQPYAPPILHTFLDSRNVYPGKRNGGPPISVDKCYEFWESEVKRHLLSPHRKVDRSKLPDEYGYLASEWSGQIEVPIVLLEKIH